MIYKNIPKNFNPRFEVVSCYVEVRRQRNTEAVERFGLEILSSAERMCRSKILSRRANVPNVLNETKILLLHRHKEKSQGGKWGVPAGKIDQGEGSLEAMIREAREETGLAIKPTQLEFFQKVFVRYPDYDFVYHMFRVKLESEHPIVLSHKEHQAFCWASPMEALAMNLVDDLKPCIKMFYSV
ncbi:MAG: NUDIX hydrolase [bacterium]|nr:NUDIX hydrolase [bacterium]